MNFSNPKKIFIVDDDPMMTTALSDYLTKEAPHHISCFATGEECLKHLDEKPEVMVLDYYLNSVNKDAATGIEVLEAVKKSGMNVKVIMLSSQEAYSIAVKTIQEGAEDYVIKDEDAFEKVDAIIKRL